MPVALPPWPDWCRRHMRRIVPVSGGSAAHDQLGWEVSASQQDARTDACAEIYDKRRAEYGGGGHGTGN
ncbi:hypothetical protein BJF95_06295 [Rhizobium oryziradicis]|uniref:Uncharacterized protein n=2 Tax=Rhizobium oryziradicis TaxID=1867956 RepID=A0A1Q8ZQ51_9HYPH|nr:hypothetical protein BJF95_06295 [Rhizobium oryziradicis]